MKIAQCWDDGVVNDIRLAELFRKYNAKATFNLNPGFMKDERIPDSWLPAGAKEWAANGYRGGKVGKKELLEVYKGFEVASHCWCHETVGYVDDDKFTKAAIDARLFLEDVFQRPCHGFAWPCGAFTPETCDRLREAGFEYGRTTKSTDDPLAYDDPMQLHSHCHFQDPWFYDKYEKAKAAGCKFFYFWGHSYEMYTYDKFWEQFEMKLKYISDDKDAQWANVIDIVREPR